MGLEERRAVVTGVASYLPEGRLTNEMLVEEFPGSSTVEQIVKNTGIQTRCVAAEDEFTSDLATKAALRLFADNEAHREGIDFIILVTLSPDYAAPCTAGYVQEALGFGTEVGAVDVVMGCSGYTYGLGMAGAMVESGRAKKILLLTADRTTTYTQQAQFNTKVLIGDAGTASIVEAGNLADPIPGGYVGASRYGSDATGAENLIVPNSGMKGATGQVTRDASMPVFEMDGNQVFNFSVMVVPGHIQEVLDDCGLEMDDIDLFVFHQPNEFMLKHLRRKLRISEERFVIHMSETGNTVASTVPLALEAAIQAGRVQPGMRVLLTAFGTGYSWGSVLLEYPELPQAS